MGQMLFLVDANSEVIKRLPEFEPAVEVEEAKVVEEDGPENGAQPCGCLVTLLRSCELWVAFAGKAKGKATNKRKAAAEAKPKAKGRAKKA